ncbi:MAG: hypothetical protein IJ333_02730 [Clostridia bacterium]|nr:hypothetical protein [Clostridia bacterium]
MKVTQYFTDAEHSCLARPVFPAVEMGGAVYLEVAKEPLPRTFEGFGVAITGSSCYNLFLMEQEERTAFLKSIYSSEGLGLTIGRLSVGSSDYSAELYSYDDVEGDVDLKYFSVERDEAYIIPMIQEILAINPDLKLFASPWSPPGWMKTGGNMCGGYMREEYLECYAEYYLRFLQEYDKRGIHISALTPQNEPETQQRGRMPACQWHPELEAKFIAILRRKLDEAGMQVDIWMLDHSFDHWNRVLWSLDTYPQLQTQCKGVAFHYYSHGIEDTARLQKAYPQMEYHFTEAGPRLYDHYDTDWCKWVTMMVKVLSCGYSTFTGWNLMLDETGGPNIGPFFCGGLVTRNTMDGTLSYSGQYKAFQQISHFVCTGAKVYPVQVIFDAPMIHQYPKVGEPIEAVMAENPDGTRVLLLANHNDTKRQAQIFLDGQWWYMELLPDSVSTVVFEK